ncbi:hypothetical protein LXA43DRAFT_969920 [Ganoderma leucocontextum]|nr:hypothetical protein LXA43DRAFT_969920 [Ganoderma leucocontextum]
MPRQLRVAGRQGVVSIHCVFECLADVLPSRLLHDDNESSTIMIHDGEDALFVDMSLCLNAWKRSLWLRESRSVVMALGYLELSSGHGLQKALPLPLLHAHAPLVDVNPHLVLRAVVVEEARDLDLALWNRAIHAQEEAGARKRVDRATGTQNAA